MILCYVLYTICVSYEPREVCIIILSSKWGDPETQRRVDLGLRDFCV